MRTRPLVIADRRLFQPLSLAVVGCCACPGPRERLGQLIRRGREGGDEGQMVGHS